MNEKDLDLQEDTKDKKNQFRWSLRDLVARKVSSVIWGQGFVFQTENEAIEKAFNRFKRMNRLPMLFTFIERQCSKYGRCIITINKTKSGDLMLNIPNPFYFNGIGKVFVDEQLAVIWQRFELDTNFFVVKSTYDTKKCVNEVYSSTNGETIRVMGEEASILEKLQIPRVWNHDLGFVPVIEVLNIPLFQFQWNNFEFVKITDWFPAYEFEELIYNTILNLKKELFYCHTRINVTNANQDFISNVKRIASSEGVVEIGDWIIESDMGAEIKVAPGTGDFTKYTSTMDQVLDFYFKFCGQSRFSEGGGAQKTVAETVSTRSALIETVEGKIKLREQQYTDLIRKVLCALGHGDYWDEKDNFTFSINGNLMKDDSVYLDNLSKQMGMGLITTIEAIQEKFNLTYAEAKIKFEEVQAFNEKYGIQLNFDGQEDDQEGITSTGQHKTKTGKEKGWSGEE